MENQQFKNREWKSLRNLAIDFRLLEEKEGLFVFQAYVPIDQTSSLYKWKTFAIERGSLTDHEIQRLISSRGSR